MENKKDIPTLIEIAKKKLKTPIKKTTNVGGTLDQVRQFIQENNITHHATVIVPAYVIYYKYAMWCKLNNSKTQTRPLFFSKFKLYFNSKTLNNIKHYYINPTGFDLSDQNLEYIRNEEAKIKAKRKARKS